MAENAGNDIAQRGIVRGDLLTVNRTHVRIIRRATDNNPFGDETDVERPLNDEFELSDPARPDRR
ncbi:hypothetical protein [Mycobacterium sp. E3298]|uniref:hypothetical protein n=1 Tax=Mycobacterium sp. E3298 TaxID=1856865 RepID=UPI0012E9D6D1|nr:hypothetical protein [Mycobacterium sp. E3298]